MPNITKVIINTGTAAARKTKYATQNITPQQDTILQTVISSWQKGTNQIYVTNSLKQSVGQNPVLQKIQQLASRYTTEVKTFTINGKEVSITTFKGSRAGSNEGFWAELTGHDLRYIKFPKKGDQHAYSEKLASQLYNLAGIDTPEITAVVEKIPKRSIFDHSINKRVGIISKFLHYDRELTQADAKLAREGFGVDCWLANWDALKEGNTVIHNGKAIRLDVGGSLCYRAQGERKLGNAFGENVNELTSFFENFSHSKRYIKDMSREELIASIERVTNLNDLAVADCIKKSAGYTTLYGFQGEAVTLPTELNNASFLTETLLARKKYMQCFVDKCKTTPQQSGETIENYIKRIDKTIPKKGYKIDFDKIMMSEEVKDGQSLTMGQCLTPSQKKLYEDSYLAYLESSKKTPVRVKNQNFGPQHLLHATGYSKDSFANILDNGIVSGEICQKSGTGQATQTPLCADFWEILEPTSIKDYFSRAHYNKGELNFLPKLSSAPGLKIANRGGIVVVMNKNAMSPTLINNSVNVSTMKTPKGIESILYRDGNFGGHRDYITHRAVPYGVPSSAIEKIIVANGKVKPEEIAEMKQMLAQRRLDIPLYDMEGKLL